MEGKAHIKEFMKTHGDSISFKNGRGKFSIARNDGGKVPSPSINWGGHEDGFLTGKDNTFVCLIASSHAKAVRDLLQWAVENYDKGEHSGKEKEVAL